MYILAINTACSLTSIALFKRDGNKISLIAEKSWQAKNNEAEKLMPEISGMLGNAKLQFAHITEVFVIKGPGSFTGLRVGVTVANTLAYLNQGTSAEVPKCKLFAINTFEYLHYLSTFPVLLFAGSGGVYLSIKNKKPVLINLHELNDILKKEKIKNVCGDITAEQKAIISDVKFINSKKTFGQIMSEVLSLKHESLKIVEPLYIKEPGITQSKNALHSFNTNR